MHIILASITVHYLHLISQKTAVLGTDNSAVSDVVPNDKITQETDVPTLEQKKNK